MIRRLQLSFLSALTGVVVVTGQALAQEAAPAAATAAPAGFSSPAQARAYLSQNPDGARAEAAFRAVVTGDLVALYPEFDPATMAAGSALQIMPGATETPEQIEAIIAETTPGIGTVARSGWW